MSLPKSHSDGLFLLQLEFLTRLVEWKGRGATAPGHDRDVYIFGGDVHCGGHSDILLGDQLVFRQLTSSAIANTPLPSTAYAVLRLAGESLEGLGEGFSFNHHHWTRKRNYGLVNVINHNVVPGEEPSKVVITAQLIKARALVTYEGSLFVNDGEKAPECEACPACICCPLSRPVKFIQRAMNG